MTDERAEKIITIARAAGWTDCAHIADLGACRGVPPARLQPHLTCEEGWSWIPDYFEDRNLWLTMDAVRSIISRSCADYDALHAYVALLALATGAGSDWYAWPQRIPSLVLADAWQRAEALYALLTGDLPSIMSFPLSFDYDKTQPCAAPFDPLTYTPLPPVPAKQTRLGACVYDTDGDGDCQHCYKRGGCANMGGPFTQRRKYPPGTPDHLKGAFEPN